MNKLIAFDMDGTLYKTETSFIPTMRGLFDEYGLDLPGDEDILSIIGETTGYFIKWLSEHGFSDAPESVFEKISKHEYDAIYGTGELYADTLKTLEYLKNNGFTITLCTNGPERYWGKIVDKFDLNRYFDHYEFPKFEGDSKTAMLERLSEKYSPDLKIMVGDRNIDRVAALEAGYEFYGASYGYCFEEIELFERKIQKISDLIEIYG